MLAQTRTSFFQTLNELERVHQLGIELEHPIFGWQREKLITFYSNLIKMAILSQDALRTEG